jgi:hypothetical protein
MHNLAVSASRVEPVQSTTVARRVDAVLPPASDALESTRDRGNETPSWTVRAW